MLFSLIEFLSMLLTNETWLLLYVGLSSDGDKYMSFIVNMQWWLITHYITMCLIHLILLMSYVWIMCVSTTFYLFSSSFRNFIYIIQKTNQLRSYEHEERYLYWIIMMITKEITLIIAYSLLAFFFKFFDFVNNDSFINSNARSSMVYRSFIFSIFFC